MSAEVVARIPHRPVDGQVGVEDDHRTSAGDRMSGELGERHPVGQPTVTARDAEHQSVGPGGRHRCQVLLGALDDDQLGRVGPLRHAGMDPQHQVGAGGPEVLAGVALGERDAFVGPVLVDVATVRAGPREQQPGQCAPVPAEPAQPVGELVGGGDGSDTGFGGDVEVDGGALEQFAVLGSEVVGVPHDSPRRRMALKTARAAQRPVTTVSPFAASSSRHRQRTVTVASDRRLGGWPVLGPPE
jgi:hypothetical protein